MKDEARRWFLQAKDDFKAAKYNFEGNILKVAAFLCQQSIEKGFKSLLIEKTDEFPKIHDLTRLAKLVEAPLKIQELCSKINPAYIASRYPDSANKYSKSDVEKLLKYSQEVIKWLEENLN